MVSDQLVFRFDKGGGVSALYNSIPYIVSIAGAFEFYKLDSGARTGVASGPWKGSLRSRLAPFVSGYSLSGRDVIAGGDSEIVFSQTDSTCIDIEFTFTAPREATMLDVEILKLSGDLFTGAKIETIPALGLDVKVIPVTPSPKEWRILLSQKDRIVLRTRLCDFEIVDLNRSKSILLADFRRIQWDSKRSVYLGINKWPVTGGKKYKFRYQIRLVPRYDVFALDKTRPKSDVLTPFNVDSFFLGMTPKEETRGKGFYTVRPSDAIYGSPTGVAESVLQEELKHLMGHRIAINSDSPPFTSKGFIIRQSSVDSLPAEGFKLDISANSVIITGADARGCLYGVHTILSRIVKEGKKWLISCGTSTDWPDLGIRGMCVTMSRLPVGDISIVKKYLLALSIARCNTVVFLHTPDQIKSWQLDRNDDGFTKSELRDIAAYARSLCMDVWGGMTSGFSSEVFNAMNVSPGTNIYDPMDISSYDILFKLYDELLNAYSPKTLLIAHDEIKGLNLYATKHNQSTDKLLADDVNKIGNWLALKSVRTAMWGDMLLDHRVWAEKTGNANSQNPRYDSGETHLAIGKISKDMIILDWHYDKYPEYKSIEYFKKHGFTVIGCPWYDPDAATLMANSVHKSMGAGVIGTDWGLLGTLSPSATTLYTLLSGWSIAIQPDNSGKDVEALARLLRPAIYDYTPSKQTIIRLKPYANRSLTDSTPGDVLGLLGTGPVLDLRGLDRGTLALGGIDFQIDESKNGNAKAAVVVETWPGICSPTNSEITIPVSNQTATAIAFLQTAFIESPQVQPRSLGKYIIRYEGGHEINVPLIENYNITDIRSSEGLRKHWGFVRNPEVIIGSTIAWKGISAGGIPLNLQTFIWANPYPKEPIKSISTCVDASDQFIKLVLVGVTILE